MTFSKFLIRGVFALGLTLGLACGDEAKETPDAAVSDFVCDAEGANPEMGQLLNQPVESDVEVVVKQPQHSGDPGPTNLP